MTEVERRQLAAHIRQQLDKTLEEITRLEQVTQPISPDNAIGRVSRMDAIGNKAVNDRALAAARRRKTDLETALDGIDAPDFGLCALCNAPIPLARLMAIPESAFCMQCAGG